MTASGPGGADLAVYLPDSVLYRTMWLLEADPAIDSVVCSREDEGVAIAVGASLAGRLPVALMEGSGLGYCGLILARAAIHRTSLVIIASHSPMLGERFDFHAHRGSPAPPRSTACTSLIRP